MEKRSGEDRERKPGNKRYGVRTWFSKLGSKGGASRHVWFSLSALGARVGAAGAVFSRCHLPAHVRRVRESSSVLNFSACTSSEACSRKLVVSWKSATSRTRTNKSGRIKYPGNRYRRNGLKRFKSYLQQWSLLVIVHVKNFKFIAIGMSWLNVIRIPNIWKRKERRYYTFHSGKYVLTKQRKKGTP